MSLKNKTVQKKITKPKPKHVLTSCCLFFPLIRTEFYPKAVRSLWTSNASRTGILCGNGAPPQRLLSQCRVRCWYWKWSSDVPRACHETLGQGCQVRPQLLPVKPVQLSAHPDRHRARKQVGQREWWVSVFCFITSAFSASAFIASGSLFSFFLLPSFLLFLSFCFNTVKFKKYP